MNRLALALLFATAALATAQEKKESVVMRSIRNCAYIQTPDGSSGTGWVFDAERRILVTNQHVVASDLVDHARPGFRRERVAQVHDTVTVIFPAFRDDGSLITEKSYYKKNGDKLAAAGLLVRGVVIDADEARDLAVIVVDKLPPGVKAFPLAASSQDPGDDHFQIGCPGLSDFFWVYGSGKVRSRGFSQWMTGPPYTKRACQVLTTEAACNPGDSGGPVVNTAGEIVGVTEGFVSKGRALSTTIDLSEIKAFTAEVGGHLGAKTADEYRKRANYYLRRDRPMMAVKDCEAAIVDLAARKLPVWEAQLEFSAAARAVNELEISRRAVPGFVNDPSQDADLTKNLTLALQVCAAAMKDPNCSAAKANAELAAVRLAMLPAEAFIPVELKGAQWKPLLERGKDDPEYQKTLAEERKKHADKWGPKIKEVADGLDEAIKADAKVALAYQTRARLEGRKVKPDWARVIDDRTAVVKLLNTVLARNARSYLDRADAYAGARDYAKAAADCDAALKIDPRSAVAHANKSAYLLSAGDTKGAFAVTLRLVNEFDVTGQTHPAIEPLNPANWEQLANIEYNAGNSAAQAKYLTECIELHTMQGIPVPRRLYADRGDAYAVQKLSKAAVTDYTVAAATPDFLGDKKPQSALEELYQSLYGIPALQKKIAALKK